jgi:hypothetical protein
VTARPAHHAIRLIVRLNRRSATPKNTPLIASSASSATSCGQREMRGRRGEHQGLHDLRHGLARRAAARQPLQRQPRQDHQQRELRHRARQRRHEDAHRRGAAVALPWLRCAKAATSRCTICVSGVERAPE